ncbi:MAG: LysM peptidoglycan-binding domain-containing protein [Bdellovibrionales bacterium]|nr:LysM peptidoglycan-binding domain-containing protein [Bdellovibrionales bacterium]
MSFQGQAGRRSCLRGAGISLLALFAASGCGSAPTRSPDQAAEPGEGTALGELLSSESEDVISAESFETGEGEEFAGLSSDARRALGDIVESTNSRVAPIEDRSGKEEGLPPGFAKIPVEMNEHVERWIHFFTVRDRERFQRFLSRGSAYREVVQEMLRQNNVPPELYYLAMIESGYATHARSHASAVGVWQFIRATGRRYGLVANGYVDERRDPIRATEAAAKYLTDLYNVFQDWYLAFAAYNSGERRVLNAIMKAGTRDYWTLVEKRALPRETTNYVPKFLAAMIIGENPDRFGFEHRVEGEPYPDLAAVEVPSPIRLSDLSQASGVPLEELKRVNPHLLQGITSPQASTYEIWVPEGRSSSLKDAHPKLAEFRLKGVRVAATDDTDGPSRNYTIVRRGETLSGIARRNRVSVAYLKRLNGFSSDRIFAGMRLRVSAREYHRRVADSGKATRALADAGPVTRYRVRRGDNLHTIARRFGTTVASLKRLNGLRRNTIYVGQRLKVESSI